MFESIPNFCFSIIFVLNTQSTNAQVIPLPNAHSHNDYNREHPLQDALGSGFTSVEADVLYIYGELYVGHNMPDSANHKLPTLREAYLEPLYRRWQQNQQQIYPLYEGDFYLWIDIKFEAAKAYRKLRAELLPFREMLHYYENGQLHKGKVLVILSGDRPFGPLLNDTLQLATLDGRLEDLDKNYPLKLMPFISMHRRDIFQIEKGGIPNEEYIKLQNFVQQCHTQGKRTRLWATPENEAIWQRLLDAGVDLINTDHLSRLQQFLHRTKRF